MNAAAGSSLVAVRLPAGDAWWAAVRGLWDAGAAVLPLDPAAPAAALDAAVRQLRPSAVISESGREPVADGRPVAADTAAVIATSGSTGTPKGVVLSHAALRSSAAASLARLGAGTGDRWLCCLPLQHVAGLQVLVRSQLLGVAPLIHPAFDVHAVAAERSATMVSLVPTMLRRLLDSGADLSHLRCVLLGGAPPGPQLLADAAAVGLRVVTTYGMTETSGGCVYDGRPLDGVEVEIDADGRILIRGPVLLSGYRGSAEDGAAALRDGWLQTQDLGRWEDGRLEVLGRTDDVIITGGQNVAATWVAGLLEQHPAIVEAAVVGRPDPEWGQRVVAYVVVRGAAPSRQDLRAFLQPLAPLYAVPREVIVVPALPRLPNGKIDRLALAANQEPPGRSRINQANPSTPR